MLLSNGREVKESEFVEKKGENVFIKFKKSQIEGMKGYAAVQAGRAFTEQTAARLATEVALGALVQ